MQAYREKTLTVPLVSERNLAEQHTGEYESMDTWPMGVILLDTRGRVCLGNPAAVRLLGEPLVGQAWCEVIRRCFVLSVDDIHGVSLADGRRVQVATASLPDQRGQLVLLNEIAVQVIPQTQRGPCHAGKLLPDEEPVAVAASSREMLALARRMAATDATVMICGESGTGKEVLARYIHLQSPRAAMPFVAINCAAIPENMLEATLFGYEKGAFTGAVNAVPGKFEQANGGTLLLDEISEMPPALQAKLLRVLQEKEVERLGSRRMLPLDVRVIATSNRDLREAVASGQFREDLYFRLCVLPLQWKPLRARTEDILPLARRLLAQHAARQQRDTMTFSPEAEQALQGYHYPGNVRELDNIVQRAMILQPGTVITVPDLYLDMQTLPLLQVQRVAEGCERALGVEGSRLVQDVKTREYQIIVETLQHAHGSRKFAAERLGISPRTLRYKMAQMREQGVQFDAVV